MSKIIITIVLTINLVTICFIVGVRSISTDNSSEWITESYQHHTSSYNHNKNNNKFNTLNTIMALFTTTAASSPKLPAGSCRYIQATRKQNHQCRKDFGLPDAIREAQKLAITNCAQQFRYNRWNCSIESRGKRNIFQKVYRESAFVHALTAAALTYSIARACAEGKMVKCHCDTSGTIKPHQKSIDLHHHSAKENTKTNWRWGGCSDNVRHGKRITRNFLNLHSRDGSAGDDEVGEILRHNSEVGIEIAMSTITEKCKCHGVSGSCSMKTCWRKLNDFNSTSNLLMSKYHKAIRKLSTNKSSRRRSALAPPSTIMTKNRRQTNSDRRQNEKSTTDLNLYYLETSPTFCAVTRGRNCQHPENCATLCCGRGYAIHLVRRREQCRCRFKQGQCCHVVCDYCVKKEERYFCK